MSRGQIFEGTAVITIYNNQTLNGPFTPQTLNIDLSKVNVTWKGETPPITGSNTLAFTSSSEFTSGYTADFIYNYDLHGHTSGATSGGLFPQLVSTIYSTVQTEKPVTSTLSTNAFGGTDWWY